MKILITGAAGFIGSHLADTLTASGAVVVGLDNYSTGHERNVQGFFEVIYGDVAHINAIVGASRAPDIIIHCAASYRNPDDWSEDVRTNTLGTAEVVKVAKLWNARLVYFQTALPPISSYAISKIAGEQYINLSGVPALIFRLANIYGPRNLSGPIPTFFKRLTAGEPCTVTDTARDMVYIDDLVRLVVAAIDRGATGKYDVCSGRHYPISALHYNVAHALGMADVEADHVPAGADDVKQMELNPTKAVREFDWFEAVPLIDGIGRAVAWYREHGVGDTYTHLKIGAKA